jgi:hypothetical protein
MPKPQQTDQPCAGFVFLVDSWLLCDTFRIRLTNEVEEMNKQELLDSAVHEFGGKWPNRYNWPCKRSAINGFYITSIGTLTHKDHCEWFNDQEFQQRARELGYINGYRYGVEYRTNGKRPDLPDDCSIQWRSKQLDSEWLPEDGQSTIVGVLTWRDGQYNVDSFKITDQRYKPADTSYLSVSEIPESKSNAENVSDWYDYEAQKAVALPPVGVECESLVQGADGAEWVKAEILKHFDKGTCACFCINTHYLKWADDFRPLDHATRKAEAEKKRVVDAAFASLSEFNKAHQVLGELYEAGFLRMPAE